MILKDTAGTTELVPTGEYDPYGNPEYEEVPTSYPAEVRPLESSETVAGRNQVISRYRVFMPPRAAGTVQSSGKITWRGKEYQVQGDVEQHTLSGRLHHIEFIAQNVTG